MTEASDESSRAAELRSKLVAELTAAGSIASKEVEAAFRTVPRHLFAPGATLEEAYAPFNVVVTKRDEHGTTISSVSAPSIQAVMLEQADLRRGMRCLEIGSGGYNAALMAELAGPDGEVTTLDIDSDITDRARACLSEAGYGDRVRVVLGDGEEGCPEHAPYDRTIVTVGAWDIPPAWTDQLTDDGTLTIPLRMRGLTRSITFAREADHLVSRSAEICGFVTMQGAGAHRERLLLLRGEEIGLRFDEELSADPDALNGALDTPRTEVWTGVTVGRAQPFDTLQMWLATALDGFCLLSVDPKLDTGLVAPQNRMACPAVVEGGSFAYLALRKLDQDQDQDHPDRTVFEFGAHGFGPEAAALAEALAAQIRVWDHDHRTGPGPRITAHPAGTADERLPVGRVIPKRHVRVVISWPAAVLPTTGQAAPYHLDEKE
ncbi:methyltransferase, FxLD system [Actinacidiphila sp. ITFR-21]|uniref:methyltransferase, FxLD system n=1 Tax=Actinacidiphila sp. ITFR-21 TaxID=3075199 RepID=UPI00288C6031|nr:methyltransferase, FxLD system [Streptomyces sp. ITFR-21]WNI16862.1 methyltransferase, FxLD system [Streptomyces sp. ITFR-21]